MLNEKDVKSYEKVITYAFDGMQKRLTLGNTMSYRGTHFEREKSRARERTDFRKEIAKGRQQASNHTLELKVN